MDNSTNVKKSYTFPFKMKVIKLAEATNNHAAAKLFQVDRKRVREWNQNKTSIQEGRKTQNV